jgi:hypothetical protein
MILEDALRRRVIHSSQHSQSLARSVILTCFNLLESFVSGLATGWLMENPSPPDDVLKTLQGKRLNGRDLSLREKVTLFPSVISGKKKLEDAQAPFARLFGECKQRRDSFVHCEPGSTPTKWGYVKEERFHDVEAAVVEETVKLTIEAICLAWQQVHLSDRPRWLPEREATGRFKHIDVALVPINDAEPIQLQ